MGKFYGPIGYGVTNETRPGVWENGIISEMCFNLTDGQNRAEILTMT